MAIKITVGEDVEPVKIELQVSKLLNNDYYIPAHSRLDIIIQRGSGKVLALPKEKMTDEIYEIQNRLFDFLVKHGVVDVETVQAGNVYGGLEGTLLGDQSVAEQAGLLAIKEFLDEEKPLEEMERDVERDQEVRMLLPDDDESTELGDVKHQPTQGTVAIQALNPIGGAYFFEGKRKKGMNKNSLLLNKKKKKKEKKEK